jgi:AbrB family looped-hinge helix DNA binding protein
MTAMRRLKVVEDGQIPLPEEVRQRLGLKKGTVVEITETHEGVLISTHEQRLDSEIAELDAALEEYGITFDELIESGREMRGEIAKELYGIDLPEDEDARVR